MTVKQMIEVLSQCDPDALVVAHLAFQGNEEITSVWRKNLGGVGNRMSFEEVSVVLLQNGNVPHMRSQGLDVLPVPEEVD